jgi:heme exporter protein B
MGAVAAAATAVFFRQPLAAVPGAAAAVALGLAGWSAAGILLAAVASAARTRDVLLPVVLYPLMLPLIPPAVRAAEAAFGGDAGGLAVALGLLAAFDVVYVVVGWLAFPVVAEAVAA